MQFFNSVKSWAQFFFLSLLCSTFSSSVVAKVWKLIKNGYAFGVWPLVCFGFFFYRFHVSLWIERQTSKTITAWNRIFVQVKIYYNLQNPERKSKIYIDSGYTINSHIIDIWPFVRFFFFETFFGRYRIYWDLSLCQYQNTVAPWQTE